jgi:uncharacterized protein with beta-barrel porin domain
MGEWGHKANYKCFRGTLDMPSLFGSGRVWAPPTCSAFRALAAALTIAVVGGAAAPAWSACLTSTLVLAAPPYTNSQCITPPVNNDGIDSTGSSYTLNNSGAITVQATLPKGVTPTDAIDAQSTGNLTVINSGALSATSSGTGSAAAIQAFQNVVGPSGTVTVTNNGAITFSATGGNLTAGIAAEANQIASVTNNSTITGTADSTSLLEGISATTGFFSCTGGTCTAAVSNTVSNVTNNGTINLNGPDSTGITISSTGAGSTVNNVTNNGTIIVNGTDSVAVTGFAEITPATCPLVSCTFTFGPVNIANSGLIQAGSGAFLFFTPFFLNNPINFITNTGILDGQFRDPALSSSTFTETDLTNEGLFYISYPGAGLAQIIDGKFTQTASGTLGLRINAAGQSDFLTARSVDLGGTLLAIMQPGNYANVTNYLGVVQSTAAITTQFANVETSSAFFLASATYNTNSVDLTVTREQFGLVPGLTPNERAVGNALEAGFEAGASSGPGASIYTALFGLPSLQQAAFAYDQLSGEIHASTQSVMLDQSFYAREAMLSRMRQFGFGGTDGALVSLGSGGPALAYAEPNGNDGALALGYAAGSGSAFPLKAPPAARSEPDLVYWAQGVAAWGRLAGDGNAATVTDTLGGFFSGLDKRLGDWRAGLMLGYTGAGASLPARGSSANIDTAHLGAYAGTGWGAWHLRTGGELAWSELSTDRSIAFPGFMDTATSHYGADEGQVFGELGYGMSFGRIAAEAFGGLAGVTLHTDSFTEIGGPAALNGAADNDTVGYTTLGARAATTFDWGGMALTPRVSAAWQHAFGDITPTAALSFQTIGTAFTIAGVPIARDAALVDAGADLALNSRATIGVAYVGQLAGRDQDNSVNGTFRLKF